MPRSPNFAAGVAAVDAAIERLVIEAGDRVTLTLSAQYTQHARLGQTNIRRHLFAGSEYVVVGSAGEHSDRLLCADAESKVFSIARHLLRKIQ